MAISRHPAGEFSTRRAIHRARRPLCQRRRGQLPDAQPRARPGDLSLALPAVPGFAALAEMAYAFIARHRPGFYRISLFFWGKDYRPPRFDLVSFRSCGCLRWSTSRPSSLSRCSGEG